MQGFFNSNFWKVTGIMVAIYAGTFLTSTAIGLTLPDQLEAKRTVFVARPPATVWQAITNRSAEPRWRPELLTVTREPDHDGRPVWRETYWSHQKIDLEQVERSDGGRERRNAWVWDDRAGKLVLRTVDRHTPHHLVQYMRFQALPVLAGGRRTIDVAPAPGGSLVTIREQKTIRLPPFRTWARLFVLPQLASVTVDRYLADLGRRVGTPPTLSDRH